MENIRDTKIQSKRIQNYKIYYFLLPYKRNQDVIVFSSRKAKQPWISVVDGWTNPKFIKEESLGREAALWIARRFPRLLLAYSVDSFHKNAPLVARKLDEECMKRYPHDIAVVGAFFIPGEKMTAVTVGSIDVFSWNGSSWIRSKKQGDYSLPYPKYPTDVSRFFGLAELKRDSLYASLYSCEPDVFTFPKTDKLLVATDGLGKCISMDRLNTITRKYLNKGSRTFLKELITEIKKTKNQNDDITVCFAEPNVR